jgi:hypothetical protein
MDFLDLNSSSKFREIDEKNRIISKNLPFMTSLRTIDFGSLKYAMPLLTFVDRSIGGQLRCIRLGFAHNTDFLSYVNPKFLESFSIPEPSRHTEEILTSALHQIVELGIHGESAVNIVASLAKVDTLSLKYLKIHATPGSFTQSGFVENLGAISQKPSVRKIWLLGDIWRSLIDRHRPKPSNPTQPR